jgi:protein-disulfide isomerase
MQSFKEIRMTMKHWLPATALMMIAGSAAAQTAAQAAPAPKIVPPTAAATEVALPPVNPKNFTADTPTADTVNAFLKSLWGYDANRVWSVAAVLKTSAPGVAKIVVFVAEKGQPGAPKSTVFFTTPDGKHAIAESVIDFGATPFAETRKTLQQSATGPARGATGKDLMLVEFADLQCPHCKEAQDTMDRLAHDFPEARLVFENFPLVDLHPYAMQAAAEGVCVRKAKGDAAFFSYAAAVYDKQAALTPEQGGATLAAAATTAGADPKAAATCAATPAAKDDVTASLELGKQIGVDQTPMLYVNGRALPITALPYETLKQIVAFQAAQDGITVHLQPSLNSLK